MSTDTSPVSRTLSPHHLCSSLHLFPTFHSIMNIPYRTMICVLLGSQVLLFTGLIVFQRAELAKEQMNLSMCSLFFLITVSFLLLLTSLLAFIVHQDIRLLYLLLGGTVIALCMQTVSIFAMSVWWHCLFLAGCASTTALVLICFNALLSNLLYEVKLNSYPTSPINHRFSNCQLEDLSTFRRYTLDPDLAREQIMMHQARSNNRKSFLFVIPSDDPSYAHPTSNYVDC